MNLLRKGFNLLFPMSAEEEQVDVIEQVQEQEEEEEKPQPVVCQVSPVSELEIEEDKDEPVAAEKHQKKKSQPRKKRAQVEEGKACNADALQDALQDPLDLSDAKAAKRIALAGKAKCEVVKLDARTRELHVTLPGSKKPKKYPYIDFVEELIPGMVKLVEERPKLKGQLCLLDCANHSPRLFWNAIHHWHSTDVLEEELQKAGLTKISRRRRTNA